MKRVRHWTRPIPVCQEKLLEIAADLSAAGHYSFARRVFIWQSKLSRRKAVRRAPVQQRHVSNSMAKRLKRYLRAHPRVSYQTAAHRLNINTGRSSEANVGIKV